MRLDGHNERASAIEAKYHGGAPDYSRMGDLSQPLNQLFMFVNAAAQYPAQFADALRKDPKRIGGIMVAMTAATAALSYWNAQQKDSEGKSLYAKVPVYERERNWVVLSPWTHKEEGAEKAFQFNVPKPFIGRLMTPVDDIITRVNHQESRTGTQQALDSIASLSPLHLRLDENRLGSSLGQSVIGAVHPLIKTVIEQYANRDEFGYPIVPPGQEKIDPSQQIGPRTSNTAQAVGAGGPKGIIAGGLLGGATGSVYGGLPGAITGATIGATVGIRGASPRRIDAGMRSMFAAGGTQTEQYFNPFFSGQQAMKQDPFSIARSAPIIGGIVQRFMGGAGDQRMIELTRQFNDLYQDAVRPYETVKELGKTSPQSALLYLQQNRAAIERGMGIATSPMQQRMTEFAEYEQQVRAATDIPDDKKEDYLEKIHNNKIHAIQLFIDSIKKSPQVGQAAAFPGQGQGSAR